MSQQPSATPTPQQPQPQQPPAERPITVDDVLASYGEEVQAKVEGTVAKMSDGTLVVRCRAILLSPDPASRQAEVVRCSGSAPGYVEAGDLLLDWATDAAKKLRLLQGSKRATQNGAPLDPTAATGGGKRRRKGPSAMPPAESGRAPAP